MPNGAYCRTRWRTADSIGRSDGPSRASTATSTVRTLIAAGVDVDHVNNLHWTALLEAIILGDRGERYQRIVALLVEAGADVNLADGEGVTPLQHARARL
jgi:ankyrin repeat protein